MVKTKVSHATNLVPNSDHEDISEEDFDADEYLETTNRDLTHDQEVSTLDHQNVRPNLKARVRATQAPPTLSNKKFKEFDERLVLLEEQKQQFEGLKKELEEQKEQFEGLEKETKELKLQVQQLQNMGNINTDNSKEQFEDLEEYEETPTRNVTRNFHSLRNVLSSCGEECNLSNDTFSFIVCSDVKSSQFWLGIFIFILQFLLMMTLYVYFWRKIKNGDLIQANASSSSRIVQYLATTLAIITQNDFRLGLTHLQEGFQVEIGEKFEHAGAWKWNLANTLRMIIGGTGILASTLVIVSSTDVLEILMNFAGLEVLLNLDDQFFELCASGIFGIGNNAKTKEIQKKTYRKRHRSSCAYSVLFSLSMMSFAFLGWTNYKQIYNEYLLPQIKVEFADNADADIGVCSGVYIIDPSNKKDEYHVRYVEERRINDIDGKMIAYCKKGYWTLTDKIKDNPCKDYLARSGVTDTYVVEETKNTLWTAKKNLLPLDFVLIEKFEPELKQCESSIFVGDDGNYNEICNDPTTCTRLEVSEVTFGEKRLIQKGFVLRKTFMLHMLHGDKDDPGKAVAAYGRPIFVEYKSSTSNSTRIHYHLVLFTGRRWIATSTENIGQLQNITGIIDNDMRDMKKYFINGFYVFDLLSKGIISMSEATLSSSPPINLKWHGVKYLNFGDTAELIPSEDIDTKIDDAVICAVCSNTTNTCQNKGLCADDGVCECLPTSAGALCQNPFTVEDCVLEDLITYNLNISFDGESDYGKALYALSTDTAIGCEYESWVQRYIVAILLQATNVQRLYDFGINECSFQGFACNNTVDVSKIDLSYLTSGEGFLPTEIFLLTSLEKIVVTLTEQLPSEIRSLTSLEYLSLVDFFGPFPSEIGLLTKLTHLSIFQSKFTGQIPSEIGLLQNLTFIDLDGNDFFGQIPSELGQLTKLSTMYIARTNLFGEIPSEFGLLTELDGLYLNANKLSGTVPMELGFLTGLKLLSLNENSFTGSIPAGLLLLEEKGLALRIVGFNTSLVSNVTSNITLGSDSNNSTEKTLLQVQN